MTTFQIVGLKNKEQARRIKGRFCDVLGFDEGIQIDFQHATIDLPSEIDPYTVSLIGSFEQVSIVDHDINHNHVEDTGHHHHHHEITLGDSNNAQRNMLIVFGLNLFFSISEFIFGALFKSQAILSDAVHDLGDALSIGLAYLFEKISNKSASNEYSYGYRRFSLLGALVTSIVLILGASLIIINTIPLLFNPQPVNHQGVFWVAIGAILINGFSVWLMRRGHSANEKLLNIHLLEDLIGWLAVLAMSVVLEYTNWYILDPLLSIAIASWILYVTLPEFYRISKIFLQAVPSGIDINELKNRIQQLDNVNVLSHFHIWSTDGEQHMMTLTVTTDQDSLHIREEIKINIRRIVLEHNISHITIEVLYDPQHLIKESISCEG